MLTCGAIVLASLYIKLNVGIVELWSCDSHSNCRYKQELRGTYNSNQEESKQMTSRSREKKKKETKQYKEPSYKKAVRSLTVHKKTEQIFM